MIYTTIILLISNIFNRFLEIIFLFFPDTIYGVSSDYQIQNLSHPRLSISSQQQLQRIRRLPFRLLNGVDVAVGGFELGVAEAGCYVFDIGAVAQQQRR